MIKFILYLQIISHILDPGPTGVLAADAGADAVVATGDLSFFFASKRYDFTSLFMLVSNLAIL